MTGTVMERSHAKLTQWAAAFHLGASSKKGFSAHQLHRELGCQYNTAWFLHHRVMEAMRRGGLDLPPIGGEGQVVEADETYFGQKETPEAATSGRGRSSKRGGGPTNKRSHCACRAWRQSALVPSPRADGTSSKSCATTSPAKAACTRTKAISTRRWAGICRS